jgi:hypothetical protein
MMGNRGESVQEGQPNQQKHCVQNNLSSGIVLDHRPLK